MGRKKDYTNYAFPHFTVLYFDKTKNTWICLCNCGKKFEAERMVRHTAIKSCGCGCNNKNKHKNLKTQYEIDVHRTYHIWCGMKNRCNNPNNGGFKSYGGRGIFVCDEWNTSFDKFLNDMGPHNKGLELDRINGHDGYYKENCRWATREENSMNRTSLKPVIDSNTKEIWKSLSDCALFLNGNTGNLSTNIKKGIAYKGRFIKFLY